jgi:tRNA dimethylallyltransferase
VTSPVYVLLGSTASGKTAVSLPLAEILGAEIVCLDSRQVFKGMEIGTAQPTSEEQASVPHHLFGVIRPGERFSAGDYGRLARKTLAEIESRGAKALFVGGAGLYLRALEGGLAEGLPHDAEIRQQFRNRAAAEGSAALHAELEKLDPSTAARLHPNDAQRITRALEIITMTKRPVSELIASAPRAEGLTKRLRIVVLERGREDVYRRIEERTDVLLITGMIEEARRLLEDGLSPDWPVYKAHGYPEIARWLHGDLDWTSLRQRLAQVTRNYAKRQMTWFRKIPGARFLPVPEREDPAETARRSAALLTHPDALH